MEPGAVGAARHAAAASGQGRVAIDGKLFARGGQRFSFRGVTYGTFRPREADGARYPVPETIDADFAAIRAAGFTVVRTYTPPPDDALESARIHGLHLLPGLFHPDLRHLVGASRRQRRTVVRDWQRDVAAAAARLRGADHVVGVCLGNEIPADVVRWNGVEYVAGVIDDLAAAARDADPDLLVTYANYPTAEYLPLDSLDFVTFNVYLEQPADFRKYLTRLQNLAGDRPLVLGEIGSDSAGTAIGEAEQAEAVRWQMETAIERGVAGTCVFTWTDEWWVGDAAVEGWSFGLTRADRTPKPALATARHWNERDVSDLDASWPSISVVICAYNAEATMDECLEHTCRLDYPGLEILVIDDGSTDRTAEITARHPRARLITIAHGGLSVARNTGLREAAGELVAYLDSDAYPPREWPYFLALGLDGRDVGGAGGPNLAPVDDPRGAQAVALAPGGPAHVLLTDHRAEHLPGCNMAFWKIVLDEVGGFDPVYTSAGDDVDLCWKVLDAGWSIAFHPAAVVWHHRRGGTRAFMRQQRGYGRAESLVAARHPHRFTKLGTARWRGRIYVAGERRSPRGTIYHGPFASAAFQSVYGQPAHALDVAHMLALPAVAVAIALTPLGLLDPAITLLPALVVAAVAGLFVADVVTVRPPRSVTTARLRFRLGVAALRSLQPMARWWGRVRSAPTARRDLPRPESLPGPATRAPGGVLVLPADRPRADIARIAVNDLAATGRVVVPGSGWEPYDALVIGSVLVRGELVTSAFPHGAVQLRIRRRLRRANAVAAVALAMLAASAHPVAAAIVAGLAVADIGRGLWNLGPRARAALTAAGSAPAAPSTPVTCLDGWRRPRNAPITRFETPTVPERVPA